MRSWPEIVFVFALDAVPTRRLQAVVDSFYQAYEEELGENPEGHSMYYIHVDMVNEQN